MTQPPLQMNARKPVRTLLVVSTGPGTRRYLLYHILYCIMKTIRTWHTACWKKTAKDTPQANSKVTSGPKFCNTTPKPDNTTPQPGGDSDNIRVMSYNLYGWNALRKNAWKAKNVYNAITQINPDLLGAQECEGLEKEVAEAIGSEYAIAGSATAGHSIIYKTTVFNFEGHGVVNLHEKDQWGLVILYFSNL